MPTYNFKKQFVPFIEAGTKTQTVRAYRKDGRLPVPGQPVHLFTGMRQPGCTELLANIEKRVERAFTIFIFPSGNIYLGAVVEKDIALKIMAQGEALVTHQPAYRFKRWNTRAANRFAWLDGFRATGTSLDKPGKALQTMIAFWKEVHTLPFTGTVTYW